MKDYTPENPVFSESIKIYEVSDPAHADLLNNPLKQLLQNTMANAAAMPGYSYDADTRGIIIKSGAGSGGGPFILPIATADRLGGVKIGSGITVEPDGTISSTGGSGNVPATDEQVEDMIESLDDLSQGDEGGSEEPEGEIDGMTEDPDES